MKFKILILSIGSLILLTTSFCTHQNKLRGVSSEEINKTFSNIEPLVRINSKKHKLLIFEKMHNTRSASILVEYQCSGKGSLSWESFQIERFLGVSEVINDSIVRVRYIPLSLLDFSNLTSTPTDEEIDSTLPLDKIYDLSIACGKK